MSAHPSGGVLGGLLMLVGRLGLAAVFAAHGIQKVMNGVPNVASGFAQQGIPFPEIVAWLVVALETGGAVLLAVGLLTRVVAILFAANMIGALALVHLPQGFLVADGGYEFVLALAAGSLLLTGAGAGRVSLDAIFRRRRSDRLATRTTRSGTPEPVPVS